MSTTGPGRLTIHRIRGSIYTSAVRVRDDALCSLVLAGDSRHASYRTGTRRGSHGIDRFVTNLTTRAWRRGPLPPGSTAIQLSLQVAVASTTSTRLDGHQWLAWHARCAMSRLVAVMAPRSGRIRNIGVCDRETDRTKEGCHELHCSFACAASRHFWSGLAGICASRRADCTGVRGGHHVDRHGRPDDLPADFDGADDGGAGSVRAAVANSIELLKGGTS